MANEKRLIDAHDLWSDIMMLPHNGDMISSEEVEQAIKDSTTVNAVEVVHGWWELYPSHMHRRCSVCKVEYDKPKFNIRANYCPNCGAKMDGDGNA